jgi:hypothetical protein
MRFLGASKRPLHPPGAASQSTECIEADWLGTRRSSSPLTQKRDHGIHACEVPATRRTEDLIELTSQLESGKAIEAVKTGQIQNKEEEESPPPILRGGMQILVKPPMGETVTLEVGSSDTAVDVTATIRDKEAR